MTDKAAQIAAMRDAGTLPKHVEEMLSEGVPLGLIRLPGEARSPVSVSIPSAAKNEAPTAMATVKTFDLIPVTDAADKAADAAVIAIKATKGPVDSKWQVGLYGPEPKWPAQAAQGKPQGVAIAAQASEVDPGSKASPAPALAAQPGEKIDTTAGKTGLVADLLKTVKDKATTPAPKGAAGTVLSGTRKRSTKVSPTAATQAAPTAATPDKGDGITGEGETMQTKRKTTKTRKASKTVKTAKRATTKKARTSARTPVEKTAKTPKGKVVDILKLASRPNGASRVELNELTKWTGAPWKWLFQNPKKNGYCDRWGYKLDILEGKEGEARYKVTKKG